MAFHRNAADGIDRIEEAGVLHHEHRFMPGGIEPAADGYTLIFLAHLHGVKIPVGKNALKQIVTGHTVRQRHDKANAGAFEFAFDLFSREWIVRHATSNPKCRGNSSIAPTRSLGRNAP